MVQTGTSALFLAGAEVISLERPKVGQNLKSEQSVDRYKELYAAQHQQRTNQRRRRYTESLVWRNVIAFAILHTLAIYGLYLAVTCAKIYTILCIYFIALAAGLGITAGAHRLWSHKCYKAKWPMRLLLAIFQTVAFQNNIYEWVRDHRTHHKFTDTDADPHNSTRGFFFSHIGWLMTKKHKDVIQKGKTVDMTDLEQDAIVMWQKKYYGILLPIFAFIIPALIPWYFWNEKFWTSFFTVSILRYTLSLNCTWLVNSAAHIWGMKPYDKTISARENITVATLTFGEGWHNYHHAFPWDYKAAELGTYGFNYSTAFIDFCAYIGLAYDLKMATPDMILKRAKRTGDGTHHKNNQQGEIWGWDDTDMTEDDKSMVDIIYKDSKN